MIGSQHGVDTRPVGRVLVPLATSCLYGLERAVIETFDALRPDVDPGIVQSAAVTRRRLPIVVELERRGLTFSLLPDGDGWPKIARATSIGDLFRTLLILAKANWFYFRAAGRHDALYVTGSRAALFLLAAAARCRLAGRRVIHHFHELPAAPLPVVWRWMVTDCIHNTALGRDIVIDVDPAIRRKHHAVLPCIVDAGDRSTTSASPIGRNGKRNIVFAGQVALHKGVDLLVDAFGRLAERHPDAWLHVVGGCDDSFLPAFRSMCARSGAERQITYWGYRPDVLAFLRDAYVCVQPTPPTRCAESFGRAVVEAMAFGVPSVTCGSGALAEIVAHGETGLTCAENADELAAGIDRFLDDEGFRDRCGSRALARYQERYSLRAVRPMWIGFFRHVLAKEGEPSASQASAARMARKA